MKLSRTSAIAVFALTLMAESETEEFRQGRDLAKELKVPPDSLLKVLQRLARFGLLVSSRGRSGGFRLSRPPEEISLLELVEAVDGPLGGDLISTVDILGMPKTKAGVELALDDTVRSMRSRLSRTSIRDLMNHHSH
jgi:Rrf2 family protein